MILDEHDLVDDKGTIRRNSFPRRGIMNVVALLVLLSGLLTVLGFYPVYVFYQNKARNTALIVGNIQINAPGKSWFSLSSTAN